MPNGYGDAEGGSHRKRESSSSDERYPNGAEDQHQDDEGQSQHDGYVWDEHVIEALRNVIEDRGDTGNAVGTAGLFKLTLVIAQVVKGFRGLFVGRAGGGRNHDLRSITVVSGLHDLGVFYAVIAVDFLQEVLEGRHAVLLGNVGHINEGDHRGIAARTKGVCRDFISLTLRGAGLCGAIGRHGQAQLGKWYGQDAQQDDARDKVQPRVGTHATYPAQAHGGLFVLWVWNLGARHTAGEDLGTQKSQQGGNEGISNQYGDDHCCRGSDGHGAQERDADNGQRGQGDDHGGAGEDNRTARGAQRHAHGVGTGGLIHLLELLGQFLWRKIVETRGGDELVAEAVDNKQCVIDTDGQANHGSQRRGHIGDGIRKDRGYLYAEDADAHADDGGN